MQMLSLQQNQGTSVSLKHNIWGKPAKEREGQRRTPTAAELRDAGSTVLPRVSDPSPGKTSHHLLGKRDTVIGQEQVPRELFAVKSQGAERQGQNEELCSELYF
jgi:hypothetical protein